MLCRPTQKYWVRECSGVGGNFNPGPLHRKVTARNQWKIQISGEVKRFCAPIDAEVRPARGPPQCRLTAWTGLIGTGHAFTKLLDKGPLELQNLCTGRRPFRKFLENRIRKGS